MPTTTATLFAPRSLELKFEKNVARDRRNARAIRKLGWKVVTVWECQCKHPEKLSERLKRSLSL
jgi:DNA mismatch endonuclease (patch repair protein)